MRAMATAERQQEFEMDANKTILKIKGLSKSFGALEAVSNVSLEV